MNQRFRAVVGSNKLNKPNGEFKLLRYVEIQQKDGSWKPFRDHCWISYNWSKSSNLDRLKLHQKIEFNGTIYNYIDSQLKTKKCIKKLKNIKVTGYKKLK